MSWSCCGRWFDSEHAFNQHQTYSSRHLSMYCDECDRDFDSYEATDKHLSKNKCHWPDTALECRCCNAFFRYTVDKNRHFVQDHHGCLICEKTFRSSRAREQHVASPVHSPSDKFCPFCKKEFKTFSAIAGHIESSRCVNFVSNPVHLCTVIRSWESSAGIQGTFTAKLLTNGEGQLAPRIQYDFTACYNYHCQKYECPLCDLMFSTKSQVHAHVYGSAHARQPLYHCPTCRREVISLTALLLHLEQSQCGKSKSSALGQIVTGMKMIQYR